LILSAIAAMAENRVIGQDGTLPWRLPEDMKFFKTKTSGHAMIMGRKTFDSFGGRPLPNRLHIVITRQTDFVLPAAFTDACVFHSPEEALAFVRSTPITERWGNEAFVIGGGEIYRAMMPLTGRIYLTEIHRSFEGDARFPEFDKSVFIEKERLARAEPMPFDFVTYERR
jgi:dihydrofolate reductase